MSVMPEDIAVELGRSAPEEGTPEFEQWAQWIEDTLLLIQARFKDRFAQIDEGILDYVVRQAVASRARRPDSASSMTVTVDDGTVTRRYENGDQAGSAYILDEWWDLLQPGEDGRVAGAFTIKPAPQPKRYCW
jgi:hypothetical protein